MQKNGRAWLWARGAPQNLGFPFNIYTMAEATEFKFGTELGFAKPTIKPHPEDKLACPCVREAPKYLGFPFNIFATARCPLSVSGASCFIRFCCPVVYSVVSMCTLLLLFEQINDDSGLAWGL